MADILRGEVWLLDLNPTMGREQAGTRPALVVSEDLFNLGPAELVIVVPITSHDKRIRSHVRIAVGDGGLLKESFAKCEDVRSVSKARFIKRYGRVPSKTMQTVEERLRFLMGL